jgi:hypothetical protein
VASGIHREGVEGVAKNLQGDKVVEVARCNVQACREEYQAEEGHQADQNHNDHSEALVHQADHPNAQKIHHELREVVVHHLVPFPWVVDLAEAE